MVVCFGLFFCSLGLFGFIYLILCLQVEKSIRLISESENLGSTYGVLKEVCARAGLFGGRVGQINGGGE